MNSRSVFLVGAGISIEAPASIPAALGLVRQIVERLSANHRARRRLLALFDASRPEVVHAQDFLRFETFMEVIQDIADEELSILDFLRHHRAANAQHLILARQAIDGALLVTTNFDGCLESAIEQLGRCAHTICTPAAFQDWKRRVPRGHIPVFKLHGSVERWNRGRVQDVRASIITTLAQLTAGARSACLPRPKLEFLLKELRGQPLIVAGYSASDDLDIVPSLRRCRPASVVWLEFDGQARRAIDVTRSVLLAFGYRSPSIGKLGLLRGWHDSGLVRIRYMRVNTGQYLMHRFGRQPASSVSLPSSGGLDLNAHLNTWAMRHLSLSVREQVIGETFFQLGRYKECEIWFRRGLGQTQTTTPLGAHMRRLMARVLIERADYRGAHTFLAQISRRTMSALSPRSRAKLLHDKGFVAYKLRDFGGAERLFRNAAALAAKHGLHATLSITFHDQGLIWQERGHYAKAARCFRQSLRIDRRLGKTRHAAWAQFQLACVLYYQARFKSAYSLMEGALAHAQSLNDLAHLSNCGHGLALLDFQMGRIQLATERSLDCIAIAAKAGQREWAGMDWELLAQCSWESGKPREAERQFRRAERELLAVGDHNTLSEVYAYWAEFAWIHGRRNVAQTRAREALRLARKDSLPEFLSRGLFIKGSIDLLSRSPVASARLLSDGLILARQVPMVLLELCYSAARLHIRRFIQTQAMRRHMHWSVRIYRSIGNLARAREIGDYLMLTAKASPITT